MKETVLQARTIPQSPAQEGLFARIYRIVACIPRGKVATYGQIAAAIGMPRAARTVGWAMWSVPRDLDLPCHRVVNRRGEMAPEHIFGGADRQRALLLAEGVAFTPDGRVDMKRCMVEWRGGSEAVWGA